MYLDYCWQMANLNKMKYYQVGTTYLTIILSSNTSLSAGEDLVPAVRFTIFEGDFG